MKNNRDQRMGAMGVSGKIIQVDENQIRDHLSEMVRDTVEDTLNHLLDAEADRLCHAKRYERSEVCISK